MPQETTRFDLNARAWRLGESLESAADQWGVQTTRVAGAKVIDCGAAAPGGLAAGLGLARICLADLATVEFLPPAPTSGLPLPTISVHTDHPVLACMASQYAGWRIAQGDFFAMGSGPMRAIAGKEELIASEGWGQTSDRAVGVLETAQTPTAEVVEYVATACGVPPERVMLLFARTASLAGGVQVVARSLETALHKLHDQGFPLAAVRAGAGAAPLPPIAADDLIALGWTNDAVLYGATVQLWVDCEDELIRRLGPETPSSASRDYGRPFADVFAAAGRDFYKIDPKLFSPAAVTFFNLATGRTFCFGATAPDVLRRSFELPC